jgi:hypothetical protein
MAQNLLAILHERSTAEADGRRQAEMDRIRTALPEEPEEVRIGCTINRLH